MWTISEKCDSKQDAKSIYRGQEMPKAARQLIDQAIEHLESPGEDQVIAIDIHGTFDETGDHVVMNLLIDMRLADR